MQILLLQLSLSKMDHQMIIAKQNQEFLSLHKISQLPNHTSNYVNEVSIPPTVGWNNSEIGCSADDRADLPELGYSPDSPLTKLIKPKCPNTSHM